MRNKVVLANLRNKMSDNTCPKKDPRVSLQVCGDLHLILPHSGDLLTILFAR